MLVAGGSYPGENGLTGSKAVTFRVAPRATATITSALRIETLSNVKFFGPINITEPASGAIGLRVWGCNSNLEFHDVSGHTFNFGGSASHIRVYGGAWGDYTSPPFGSDSVISGSRGKVVDSCGDGVIRDIVFDGVRFHDVQYVADWGGAHPDCVESSGSVDGLTFRNSMFERCGNTFIGLYTDWGDINNVLIENNLFKYVYSSHWGIQVGNKPGFSCGGYVFRYNTYDPDDPANVNPSNENAPPLIGCGTDAPDIYGNIIRQGPRGGANACAGRNWSYNVFEKGNPCGTHAVVRDAFFVARGSNYQLRPGSPAIGRGDPARSPEHDSRGQPRTLDDAPDAGFAEAQALVPAATVKLMDTVGDELTTSAAATFVAGAAVCGAKASANDRSQAAIEGLRRTLLLANGTAPKDLCGLIASTAAGWTYVPSLRLGALARQRHDGAFRSVPTPEPVRAPALRGTTAKARAFAAAFNAESQNVATTATLLRAYAMSIARVQSAGNAQEAALQDRQLVAARAYAKQASAALAREPALRRSVVRSLKQAGVRGRLTLADARAAVQASRRGLRPGERQTLSVLGMRRGEVGPLVRGMRSLRPAELVRATFPEVLARRDTLIQLRSAGAALRRFAAGD